MALGATNNKKPKKSGRFSRMTRFSKRDAKLGKKKISSILPNVSTLLSICTGLTAVRMGMLGQWHWAVAAVLLAGLFDALDGRLARFLKSESRFGAELDSLADFVSFGVSPALVLYLWILKDTGNYGWCSVLFFTCCMGLRLARFNTQDIEGKPSTMDKNFFVGVPAPAAGTLGLSPLIWEQCLGTKPLFFTSHTVSAWMVCVGLLMVSRIPTFSFKNINVSHGNRLAIVMIITSLIVLTINYPWEVLSAWTLFYLILIPISYIKHRSLSRQVKNVSPANDATG